MKIRRAVVGNEQALAALNRYVHEMHHVRRPDYFKATRLEDVATFRERLATPTAAVWIAEQDGDAVGYVVTYSASARSCASLTPPPCPRQSRGPARRGSRRARRP